MEITTSVHLVPASQYDRLARKYDILKRNYQEALLQLEKAKAKLSKTKESVKVWQKWYDDNPKYAAQNTKTSSSRSDEVIVALEPDLPTPSEKDLRSTHGGSVDIVRGSPSEDLPTRRSDLFRHQPAIRQPLKPVLDKYGLIVARSSSEAPRTTSSQTTEGEPEAAVHRQTQYATEQDDSDIPVVVSSRSLKRHRPQDRSRSATVRADESPDQLLRIKHEDSSSPVALQGVYAPLLRTETSDLDALQGDIDTPRKRQRLLPGDQDMLRHYQRNGSLRAHQSYAQQELQQPIDGPSSRETSGPCSCENVPPAAISDDERLNRAPAADRSDWQIVDGPLRTLSTNTPIPRRTSKFSPKRTSTAKKDQHSGAAAIRKLSEDGDVSQEPQKTKPRASSKLETLLEGRTSPDERSALSPRAPTTARKIKRSHDAKEEPVSEPRMPTTARRTAKSFEHNNTTPSNGRSAREAKATTKPPPYPTSPGRVEPEHEPLRARPLNKLQLSDFKINPAHIGTDYAYNESLRRRDQKLAMPACTDPNCCGELLRSAEQASENPLPKQRMLFDDSDSSSQDSINNSATGSSHRHSRLNSSDRQVLQEYLGADATVIFAASTPDRRRDLLKKARVQAYVERHSRHRRAFERRASPPGFWRTDFPSTQEVERDREEAGRLERGRVEERWRDAVKGGGRWLFRDE